MSDELDPITQVFNAHWTLLEANQSFCDLVPLGNRIKYSGSDRRKPEREEPLTADFPEVRVVPTAGVYQLFATSSHIKFSKRLQIQAATGDMRLDVLLNPLEMAIICAMSHWPSVMLPMTWKDHKFFTKLQLGEAPEGQRQSDLPKGIRGWSTLITSVADFYILTSDIQGVL